MSVDTYLCAYVCSCMCMCSPKGAYLCHCQYVQVGVSCVLVCRRPWMLSRLQLETAMVHVQCRKRQEQATYKLNGHTLMASSVTLASSSMSIRATKQVINMCTVLGCHQNRQYKVLLGSFEYWLFFQMNIYIYIRLVWFQCKVTILFTVFKLAPVPLTRTQRATAATKYSMHVRPLLPPHPQEGTWSKASKQNEQHQQTL